MFGFDQVRHPSRASKIPARGSSVMVQAKLFLTLAHSFGSIVLEKGKDAKQSIILDNVHRGN